MDDLLKVQVTHQPGVSIVKIEGEARLLMKPLEFELAKISAMHPPVVVLEMSGLSIMSSLGMGLIVSLRNALKHHGSRLLACGVRPLVLDSFKRARLEGIFEVFETLEVAVKSAGATGPQKV